MYTTFRLTLTAEWKILGGSVTTAATSHTIVNNSSSGGNASSGTGRPIAVPSIGRERGASARSESTSRRATKTQVLRRRGHQGQKAEEQGHEQSLPHDKFYTSNKNY
jgi:hypothetical protein